MAQSTLSLVIIFFFVTGPKLILEHMHELFRRPYRKEDSPLHSPHICSNLISFDLSQLSPLVIYPKASYC